MWKEGLNRGIGGGVAGDVGKSFERLKPQSCLVRSQDLKIKDSQ